MPTWRVKLMMLRTEVCHPAFIWFISMNKVKEETRSPSWISWSHYFLSKRTSPLCLLSEGVSALPPSAPVQDLRPDPSSIGSYISRTKWRSYVWPCREGSSPIYGCLNPYTSVRVWSWNIGSLTLSKIISVQLILNTLCYILVHWEWWWKCNPLNGKFKVTLGSDWNNHKWTCTDNKVTH